MPGARLSHELFIPSFCLQSFKVGADILDKDDMIGVILWRTCPLTADSFSNQCSERIDMGEVIRFVPKSERERARLIRGAREIYDSIFPPADPVSEQQDKAGVSHTVSGANACHSEGVFLS
jgi:hypothetical protein